MTASVSINYAQILNRVEEIKREYDRLRAEVRDAGDDPQEVAVLDRLSSKIDEVLRHAASVDATGDFKVDIGVSVRLDPDVGGGDDDDLPDGEGEADWDKIEPKLEELRSIVDRLTLEGHGAATSLFNQYSEILEARTEERWADAISLLRDALALARKVLDSLDGDGSAEDDAGKEEWEALSAELAELQGIVEELTQDDDQMAGSFQSRYDEILEAADDSRWLDAVELLRNTIQLARRYMEQRQETPEGGIVPVWKIDVYTDDPEGQPVPGIEVRMSGAADMVMRTDADGMARFMVSGGGRFDIQAMQNGSQVDHASVEEEFPMNQQTVSVNLKVEKAQPGINPPGGDTPPGEAAVWKIDAVAKDPDGNFVPGVEMRVAGDADLNLYTEADGVARFMITGGGRFEVKAIQNGSTVDSQVLDEPTPMNQQTVAVNLTVQAAQPGTNPPGTNPPGGVVDTVSTIKAIVKDSDGNPVPGAGVEFSGPGGMSVACDNNGEALYEVGGSGRYSVMARHEGNRSSSVTVDTTDPRNDEVTEVELTLQSSTAADTWGIRAIVTDHEGNRASGVEVRLYGPSAMTMPTDSRGEAQFDISGPGRYMVQAFTDTTESQPEVFNETDPAAGVVLDAELQLQGAPSEPFEAPSEQNEPTLRKGDEDPDGWVEYLQKLLNTHLSDAGEATISVSGNFDSATDGAVRWFQGATECQVDGIVGNQTWSALREDKVRDAIGTDGREPGSHSEEGPEGRWSLESSRIAIYDESLDAMRFALASTGTEPISDFKADIFVDGARNQVLIGEPASSSGGQDMHVVLVTRFRERFGDGPFQIEAYLPQELGGDLWSNTVEIPPAEGPVPDFDANWSIKVTVRDQDGNPISDAGVDFNGPIGFSGMTDGSGQVTHDVRGPSRYQITALHQGKESRTEVVDETTPEDGMVREVDLTIDLSGGDQPVTEAAWTISAIVRDTEGNPLRDAGVNFDGPIGFSGMTDGSGRVTHEVQGPGRYQLQASLNDKQSRIQIVEEVTPDEGETREVELIIDLSGGDVPVEDAAWSIAATVKDQDGNAVADAGVTFDGPMGFNGQTDGSGQVTHQVQGAGRYQISATLDGKDSRTQVVEEVDPTEGTVHEVELIIDLGGGDVPQEVVRWVIGATVKDTAGNPLSGAGVGFDGPMGFTGMTDASGQITHEVQGPGRYVLKALYGSSESDAEIVEEVDPREGELREVELIVDVSGGDVPDPVTQVNWVIDAIVTDGDGNPVPQAAVDFDGPVPFTGLTDASGRVSHQVQGPGRYDIKAVVEESESDTVTVDKTAPQEGEVHQVELQVETETTEDDGNPLLADVEIEIGNDIYGSITAVFDKDGKFAGIDLKKAIAEKGLKGGADGLIAGGKVEVAAVLEGRMEGNKLVLKSVLAASGSVMVGLGVASPKAWLGLGVEFGLKFARTIETLTVDFDRSVLENAAEIIKAGGKQPTLEAAFDLPASYSLSGKFSAILGGGSGSILEGKISKTIKEYNPMIEIDIDADSSGLSVEVTAYPGVLEFVKDIAYLTNPTVIGLIDELMEIADDPEGYLDNKRDQVENTLDRISDLPNDLRDHFSEEIETIRDWL